MRWAEVIVGLALVLALGMLAGIQAGYIDESALMARLAGLDPKALVGLPAADATDPQQQPDEIDPLLLAELQGGGTATFDPSTGALNYAGFLPDGAQTALAGYGVNTTADTGVTVPPRTQVKTEPDPEQSAPTLTRTPRQTSFEEIATVYSGVTKQMLSLLNPALDPDNVPANTVVKMPPEARWKADVAAAVESAYSMKDESGRAVQDALEVVKQSAQQNPAADQRTVLYFYRQSLEAAKVAQQKAQAAEDAANLGDREAAYRAKVEAAVAAASARQKAELIKVEAARTQIDAALAPVQSILDALGVDANPVPQVAPTQAPAGAQSQQKAPAAKPAADPAPKPAPQTAEQAKALSALNCGMPTPNEWTAAGSDPFKLTALGQRAVAAKACMEGN